jgi:hypothetical protein
VQRRSAWRYEAGSSYSDSKAMMAQDARRAAEKGCFGYCMGCQGRRIHHEIASRGRDRDVAAQEDDAHGGMASLKVTRHRARACIRCWRQSAKERGETDCSQRHQRTACVGGQRWVGVGERREHIDTSLEGRSERGRRISSNWVQHTRRMEMSMSSGRSPSLKSRDATHRLQILHSSTARYPADVLPARRSSAQRTKRGWQQRVLQHLAGQP